MEKWISANFHWNYSFRNEGKNDDEFQVNVAENAANGFKTT